MATTRKVSSSDGAVLIVYEALGNETGAAFEAWQFPDKTIQASGTGTVTLEGSADNTNWEPLNDQSGSPISIDATTHACKVVLENPRYMRVKNTAVSAKVVIVGAK